MHPSCMRKLVTIALSLLGSEISLAGEPAAANAGDGHACPNPAKIKNICMAVSERVRDKDATSSFKYLYQRKLTEAACVDLVKDDQKAVDHKMQQMWLAFEDRLICNSLQFDIQNGSIIKFAINQYFDAFLDDLIAWKVNLNRVDAYDGQTVLDYVQYKIERNRNNQTSKIFSAYYDRLRRAGAKHKSEL